MQKGFTLVELLVVVLIIGILAAIALPQYEAAVEKSRMAEALVNMKAIVDATQRYIQMDPTKTKITSRNDIADLDLKGGTWSGKKYTTDLFVYEIGGDNGKVVAYRTDDGSTGSALYILGLDLDNTKTCDPRGDADMLPICSFYLGRRVTLSSL